MSILHDQARLVAEFQAMPTWEDRYQRIIALGRALPPLAEDQRIDANKVRGCSSTVWLTARVEGSRLRFQADSDAAIPKGLVALLLSLYDNRTAREILSAPPEFIEEMGLNQHLSANRANGLSAMVRQIVAYAVALQGGTGAGPAPE